jgi:hypothetical protein
VSKLGFCPVPFRNELVAFQKELVLYKKNTQTFGLFFSKMVKRTANQISTSTESALPESNVKKGRGTETTWGQKAAIMEWLELPPGDNFRLITGAYNNFNLIGVMDNFRLIIGAASYFKNEWSRCWGKGVKAICLCQSCGFCQSTLR